jgi:hypothetical protein
MRRLVIGAAAVLALAAPAAVTIGSAAPAFASGGGVSCASLKGSLTGGTVSIGKCTPADKNNKSASATIAALAGGSGTITWSKSGGTTDVTTTFVLAPSSTVCKAPKKGVAQAQEIDITGTVTGGTSTYTSAGDTVSLTVCETLKTGKLALAKGTTASL